jgi:voltage-gated potassium channel
MHARPRKGVLDHVIAGTNSIRELLLVYFAFMIVSALGFAYFEQKSLTDALWWAVVTTTTTGYGDVTPVTPVGRILGSAVMLASILYVLPLLIGHIASALIENRDAFTHEEQESLKAEIAALRTELADYAAARRQES